MQLPTQFGPYVLADRISTGGMAEVYLAKEFGVDGFERNVAVKRILPHVAEDEEFITMFKDEAKLAVQLHHGNIAQIYNLGSEADSFYIAMEYVAGKDLRSIFQRCQERGGGMPISQACFIVMKACEGLDYAHNKKDTGGTPLGIIHRDVSPPNILVGYEGEAKIIDFGVAKAAGRASKTQSGILKGKFGYMSPEQVRGLEIDRRSDIFSLGAVFWEILTGQRLFLGNTDFETLEKVRAVAVPPPRSVNPKIPVDLEKIVLRALAADRDTRFQSAGELHDAIQAFMFSQGLFYSRKDLAAWMRDEYAKEIQLEKDKAKRPVPQNPSAGRKTAPPPPPPGRRSAATVTSRPRAPDAVAAAPAGTPAPRKRKTMVMATSKPNLPPPKKPAKPQPLAAAAPVPSGDFDWDDDELETRLFDGGEAQQLVATNRASDMMSVRTEAPKAPAAAAAPAAAPVTEPGAPSHPQATPHPQGAPQDAWAAGTPVGPAPGVGVPAAGYGQAQAMPGPYAAGAPHQPKSNKAPWMLVGVLGFVVVLLGFGYVATQKPEPGPAVAAAPAPAAPEVGALTVKVQPADATVMVDGKPLKGPSPFAASQLSVGSHKIEISRDGYLPVEREIDVAAGAAPVLPFELELAEVRLNFETTPRRATVALLSGAKRIPAGRGGEPFGLKREPGATYQVEVSAPGYITQTIPLVFEGKPAQTVELVLAKDPKAASAVAASAAPGGAGTGQATGATPEPAAGGDPHDPFAAATSSKKTSSRKPKRRRRPSRSSGSSGSSSKAAKTATLAIGTFPGNPPATIYVDGKKVGKTPLPSVKVTPGPHKVKFAWPDGSKTVNVVAKDGARKLVRSKK